MGTVRVVRPSSPLYLVEGAPRPEIARRKKGGDGGAPPAPAATFADRWAAKLAQRAELPFRDFQVPGMRVRVDVFLPTAPRTVLWAVHRWGRREAEIARELVAAFRGQVCLVVADLRRARRKVITLPRQVLAGRVLGIDARNLETAALQAARFVTELRGELRAGMTLPGARKRTVLRNPPSYALPDESARQIEAQIATLRDHLGERDFIVAAAELRAVEEERRHEHFTACALRAGRCLEALIYAVGRTLRVDVSTSDWPWVSKLHASVDDLVEHALALRSASVRPRVRERVDEAVTRMRALLDSLDRSLGTPASGGRRRPRLVLDILRDLERRHEPETQVAAKALRSACQPVLELRNKAAHASANGEQAEATPEKVATMLKHLFRAVQELNNVVSIANRKGSSLSM